jgi:hypothetical protein
MKKIGIGGKWKKGEAKAKAIKSLSEALSASKMARIQRDLEVKLRQKQAKSGTSPEEVRDITIAMQAIDDISKNKSIVDGNVAGLSGNKYPRLLRAKELALRSEVLKSNPDVKKMSDLYLTIRGLGKVSSDKSLSDTQSKTTNEMSVGGIAGPDATSQGPLVWGDKGPGLMKTSPFGKVAGKSDDTKKSKTKVDIDSTKLNESEFSNDLNAMYGDKLKMSEEDKKSKEEAEKYLAGELAKARDKKAESGRRANFIINSLKGRPVLESKQPRKIKINEAKKSESKVNAAGNYTKPGMRKELFNKIMAGTKGGDPGEWSARKAQLLAREYKKAGGGYKN